MREIPVYFKLPIVFTKNIDFAEYLAQNLLKPGSIVILPADAILVWKESYNDTRNDQSNRN